jgi:hypothetical protein
MSANVSKKEAIRQYKEQKVPCGIYALRCTLTGNVWVGSSRNLDATRNRSWFTLRMGGFMDKPLQAEWNAHGEPAFQYEILEVLEEGLLPMAITDQLKQKCAHWVAQLSARALLPG